MECKKKEGFSMVNVLTNIDNIIEIANEEEYKNTKIESILLYFKLKKIVNSKKAQDLISENIIMDKNKKYMIKGTRISINILVDFICSNDYKDLKEIQNEYPSLENQNQIIAAICCYFKNNISLIKILRNS